MNRVDLFVIIVNYNAGEHLLACVKSLLENTSGISMQVMVVDNVSADGSLDQVRQIFPDVQIIANPQNVGFAAACNQGIREACGDTILLLNPDTLVRPHAVKDSLTFLNQTMDAGIVGCQLLSNSGLPQNSCRTFPTAWDYLFDSLFLPKLFPKNKLFGRQFLTYTRFSGPTAVDVVLGAFFMIKRAVIDDIGLLDEDYFMYVEERDFCYRAKTAGWKVYFYPQAEVIHVGKVSTRQHSLEMYIEQKKSMIRFHRKHDSRLKANLIKFLIFLGVFTRFLVWNILAVVNRTPAVRSRRNLYTGTTCWFLKRKHHYSPAQGAGQ